MFERVRETRLERVSVQILQLGKQREEVAGSAMDEENILKFVSAYLKKKGFKQTEHAFQEELQHGKTTHNSTSPISSTSQFDADIAKQLLSFAEYYSLSLLTIFLSYIYIYVHIL